MNRVGAGLDNEIDGAARIAARLRTRLRLGRKFVDGINRQHNASNSRNTP